MVKYFKEARKELNEYKHMRLRMEMLKEKIDSLWLAASIPTSSICVPPRENETKPDNKFAVIADIEKEYLDLYIEAEKICKKIDHKIGLIDDPILVTILRMRYCNLNTFEEMSYKLHYSIDRVNHLLSQGIEKYNEIM